MAVQSLQYSSFLGGEVSPRLQYRTDMDKFGKWFKTAENIRFHTIGSFENRPGFAKIAETRQKKVDDIVKLISFSFNDEQSYLLEFGDNYVRFYKDGKQILVDVEGKRTEDADLGTPYEIASPFSFSNNYDLKYAQSGDILFLCNGKDKVQELRRLVDDGVDFKWEFKEFEFLSECPPLDDENGDESNRIVVAEAVESESGYPETSFTIDYNNTYKIIHDILVRVKLQSGEQEIYTSNTLFRNVQEFINNFNMASPLGLYCVIRNEKTLVFQARGLEKPLSLTFRCKYISASTWAAGSDTSGSHDYEHVRIDTQNTLVYGCGGNRYGGSGELTENEVATYNPSIQASITNFSLGLINAKTGNNYHWKDGSGTNILRENASNDYFTIYCASRITFEETSSYKYKTTTDKNYRAESDFDFFSDKIAGDIFCLRNKTSSENFHREMSDASVETISEPLLGNGSWRVWTEGNWAGYFKLQYSVDNKNSWVTFYEYHCDNNKKPRNPNVSGEIDGIDDTCYIRAVVLQTSHDSYNMNIDVEHKGATVNSYYKILEIQNDRSALVKCVKNDIGITSANYMWRESVFSDKKGYPSCISFYQNRMFFGKDYTLYGSKTNDFWNFYEPIEISDDDPLNMSLLSYRVNNIKNITTIRSFFVFTQGGEFGISAEGALTQANKYLKQFSTHGSADCLPIVVGSAIIFVEKSNNRVRALQYSFESDNYEAEDISVLLEELLEKETIITTEYLPNTHEILFLAESGTVWVLKFYPEQNIFAWSHWKHSDGKIVNICVVPNGSEDDLYICVNTSNNKKQIERLEHDIFCDSYDSIDVTEIGKLKTPFVNKYVYLFDENKQFIEKVLSDEEGYIEVFDIDGLIYYGIPSVAEATLLSPEITLQDGNNSVYHKKRPFKVHYVYKNSYGFKIGVEDDEKMEPEWQKVDEVIDNERELTSGKKAILVPARYDGTSRVSFVQDEPYPMIVENINIEVDYGGK